MRTKDLLKVERFGGFAGFGLPGSALKSWGEIAISELSASDLQTIEGLFKHPRRSGSVMPDGFLYRLSRKMAEEIITIEVPEDKVPLAIRNCVRDTLE